MPKLTQDAPAKIIDIDAFANPRQGDCICLDMDEVLVLLDEPKKELLKHLSWLQEIRIKIIGVTKRTSLTPEFDDFAKLITVITQEQAASKQQRLVNYIQTLPVKPKRLIVINSTPEALENFKKCADAEKIFPTVLLNQYQRPQHQGIYTRSNEPTSIPDNLEKYDTAEFLGGNTNSTFKISSSFDKSLPPLVLKYGFSQDAIKLELLCNAIYRLLGVKVPKSEAFNTLPAELAKRLNQKPHGIFQVTEFIEAAKEQNITDIIADIKKDFVVYALLGNIDVTESENIIQDKHHNNFLINLGSNSVFMAFGNIRNESAKIVTEIESLRTIDQNKQQWFNDLTDEQIKQQVLQLLTKESKIEQVIWNLAQQLQLPDSLRMEFLQLLSDRLDNLALRFCPEFLRYAKINRSVEERQTAAGVLTYAIHNNKAVVLLAKRVDCQVEDINAIIGSWDCFGGGSDVEDMYLHNTAAREVYEESSNQLFHSPAALLNSPFHDIVTTKNGKPFVYRMYLRQHEFVNPEEFKDHEHSEYQWVKLSDLQASLQQPSIIDVNGKQTINVNSNGKTLTLYPEFYQLLKQQVVQDHISRLDQGKPLRVTHTQGTPGQVHEQKKPTRHFHSPQELAWQVKKTVLDHLHVITQLKKEKFNTELKTPEPKQFQTSSDINPGKMEEEENVSRSSAESLMTQFNKNSSDFESQTELHLRAMLGAEYDKDHMPENVANMLKKIIKIIEDESENKLKVSERQKTALQNHCLRLMKVEKQGGPERVYFYHGVDEKIKFTLDVYTAIHKLLQANPEWRAFRGINEHFKPFANIEAFILEYSNQGTGEINNNAANYNETTLSTNLFLFGNHEILGSCSIAYFLQNKIARDVELASMLKNILSSSGMPETLLDPLLRVYNQHYANTGGVLYQFSMPTATADSLAYASVVLGKVMPYKETQQLSKIIQLLKEDFASGDKEKMESAKEYLKLAQARVLVPPHMPLEVNSITSSDLNETIPQKTVHDFPHLIKDLIREMILNANEDTLHPSTPYERLLTVHEKKNTLARDNKISKVELQRAINGNQITKVKKYVQDQPDLVEYAMALCVVDGNADLAAMITSVNPKVKNKLIQLPQSYIGWNTAAIKPLHLVEAITSYGKNPNELMKACFGPTWINSLPPGYKHTVDSLCMALETLPSEGEERYLYVTKHIGIDLNIAAKIGPIIFLLPSSFRLQFIMWYTDNAQTKPDIISNMFVSLSKGLGPDELLLVLDKFLKDKPQQLPNAQSFSSSLYKLSKINQLNLVKKYIETRPDMLTEKAEDSAYYIGFDFLVKNLSDFDNRKEFSEYILGLPVVSPEVKQRARKWLQDNIPEIALAKNIVESNLYVFQFQNWTLSDTQDIQNKISLDPYADKPEWFTVFELIMLYSSQKERLLEIFYGKEWKNTLNSEALTECAKKITTIMGLNAVLQPLSPKQCRIVCDIFQKNYSHEFKTVTDGYNLLSRLSPENCVEVCLAFQESWRKIFMATELFGELISYLSLDQAIAVFKVWRNISSETFKTAKDYINFFKSLSGKKSLLFFDACKGDLFGRINSATVFSDMIELLLPSHYDLDFKIMYPFLQTDFDKWVKSGEQGNILFAPDGEGQTWKAFRIRNDKKEYQEVLVPLNSVFAKLFKDITIENVNTFNKENKIVSTDKKVFYIWNITREMHKIELFKDSNPPYTEFYEACKDKLLSFSTSVKDFHIARKHLTFRQQNEFFDAFITSQLRSLASANSLEGMCKDLTSEQCIKVCEIYSDVICNNPAGEYSVSFLWNLSHILNDLPPEQCKEVYQILKNTLPKLIDNYGYKYFNDQLNPEQRAAVYAAWKDSFPAIIGSSLDKFILIAENLTSEQCKEIFNACRKEISKEKHLIFGDKIKSIFKCLEPESFVALKIQFFITDANKFSELCKTLSPEQRSIAYGYCKDRLPGITQSDQFQSVLIYLTPDQCKEYCDACKDNLAKEFNTLSSFSILIKDLSPEQCAAVCEAYKDILFSIVNSADDFKSLLKPFADSPIIPSSLRAAIYEVCKHHFVKIINTVDDLKCIAEYIKNSQVNELTALISNYVKNFEQKYRELFPQKKSSNFISFFQSDFLDRLNLTPGTLAKFCLIKEGLKNPKSRVAQVVKLMESESMANTVFSSDFSDNNGSNNNRNFTNN